MIESQTCNLFCSHFLQSITKTSQTPQSITITAPPSLPLAVALPASPSPPFAVPIKIAFGISRQIKEEQKEVGEEKREGDGLEQGTAGHTGSQRTQGQTRTQASQTLNEQIEGLGRNMASGAKANRPQNYIPRIFLLVCQQFDFFFKKTALYCVVSYVCNHVHKLNSV